MSDDIKFIPFNCRGHNNNIKAKRITTILIKMKPNIVCLQETHLMAKSLQILKSKWFSKQNAAPGSPKSHGTAIWILNTTRFTWHAWGRPSWFIFLLKVNRITKKIMLASVYEPNSNHISFLKDVFAKLNSFRIGELLLGGDLIYVANLILDRSSNTKLRQSADTDLNFFGMRAYMMCGGYRTKPNKSISISISLFTTV